jgi:DNA-directed RNA polymerase subunit L
MGKNMNYVARDIFKAIHEGKWLSIEYRNKQGAETKYWFGIESLDPSQKKLFGQGLHLGGYTFTDLTIYLDQIESTFVLDGTYQAVNAELVNDIKANPHRYASIFQHIPNLKILNYLDECNKQDATPYLSDFSLIKEIDDQKLTQDGYSLSSEQFEQIVREFQLRVSGKRSGGRTQQLGLNLLSIDTDRGLFILAYRKVELDVRNKRLCPEKAVTICHEFGDNKLSIRQFLDAADHGLLDDFERNSEKIKDRISQNNPRIRKGHINDMPYFFCLESKVVVDLATEYAGILDMYDNDVATIPIRAFFGELTAPLQRRKQHPLALLNDKVNLDQLLAIHNAIKYPITYVQGPPGTGKTNTIINTIITAFFNERSVLFASYNNHPIDSVFQILMNLQYKGKTIPLPVIRLGNQEKVFEAIEYIRNLRKEVETITIFDRTLDKNKTDRSESTRRLSELLERHEEILKLKDRRDAIKAMLEHNSNMELQINLEAGQLNAVELKLKETEAVTDEDALALLDENSEELLKYIYYTSARYIKRIEEPKYFELRAILDETDDPEECCKKFTNYLSNNENLEKFLRIFPVVITTCISAHRLGKPQPHFDMAILDEASQCNTAMSLIPILRGNSLMLVGDPQQLNPVIQLDPATNITLREKYAVPDEYDYIKNSIYKTFLGCDAVSDEILLSTHYRCAEKIIEFSNKKYYNGKLRVKSKSGTEQQLRMIDIPVNESGRERNTAREEALQILSYVKDNPEKSIGIITPFVNQQKLIREMLADEKLDNVTCGTVHAFQGDEKDVILFSLALTSRSSTGTYEWLKNNKELINVAVSRAKEQLIVYGSRGEVERLHQSGTEDDLHELVNYVCSAGDCKVSSRSVSSRALGCKPYSTETEQAFLENLSHALGNISSDKYSVEKEVAISHVFRNNEPFIDLFYTGRFDFVVYGRLAKEKWPVLAIELDGKEHVENEIVKARDAKKNEICRAHKFELIRVENSYARRYNFIKDILLNYFKGN